MSIDRGHKYLKGVHFMIKYLNSTVFNSGCDGLVNTINCVGNYGSGFGIGICSPLSRHGKII